MRNRVVPVVALLVVLLLAASHALRQPVEAGAVRALDSGTPVSAMPAPTRAPLVPAPAVEPTAVPTPARLVEPGDANHPLELASPVPGSLRSRVGVGWPRSLVPLDESVVQRLGFGWYLDWGTKVEPLLADGLEFAQLIHVGNAPFPASRRNELARTIAANPGALWFISNEPDVPWQDNVTPEEYARQYNRYYRYIKSLDPTARVAIGGVSQPTPLRLQYLDRVLAAFQERFGRPMPVDVWNVHAFVLREERDSWGVSIPPGFPKVDQGTLYEIEDHDDLAIFQRQILDFRRWMADNGYRNWPLIVSEYGVLMPEEYGFPPEAVIDFLQQSMDFLLNARDAELGFPQDDNRLVQRLAWFSVGDTLYPTGNLIDPATGQLTPVGHAFAGYMAGLDQMAEDGSAGAD